MKKRVLWLSNNKLIREIEVPRFIKAGFEVFCPKRCEYGLGEEKQDVTYKYDESLSIDPETKKSLNESNLFGELNDKVFSTLNSCFDIAVIPPLIGTLRAYLHHFKGIIILRWIGDEEGITCTERIVRDGGYNLLYLINGIKNRFYFAYSLAESLSDECELFQGRGLYLPLPLKQDNPDASCQSSQLMVLCPNIMLDEKAYDCAIECRKQIKRPYHIFGEQIVCVESHWSDCVCNDSKALQQTVVAIEPGLPSTRLDAPWAQAFRLNIPLLYTKTSAVSSVFGNKGAGFCNSLQAEISVAQKIMNGDKSTAQRILNSQNNILRKYTEKECDNCWKEAFKKIDQDEELRLYYQKKKKICIIFPIVDLGGLLDYTIDFVVAFQTEIQRRNAQVELVFAHAASKVYKETKAFDKIRDLGVTIREIKTVLMDEAASERMLKLAGYWPRNPKGSMKAPTGILYDDGIHMLMDCDYIINTTDNSAYIPQSDIHMPCMPIYPYAVVSHDFVQRYHDTTDQECIITSHNSDDVLIPTIRNADRVFVYSEASLTDAVQYAMVSKEKITLIPYIFHFPEKKDNRSDDGKESYFFWDSNSEKLINYMKAIRTIKRYYLLGGTKKCHIGGLLSVFAQSNVTIDKITEEGREKDGVIDEPAMTSSENEVLSNSACQTEEMKYLQAVLTWIDKDESLKRNIIFDSYASKNDYYRLIRDACFVFNPGLLRDTCPTIIYAASEKIPVLCYDYPETREFSESIDLHCFVEDKNDMEQVAKKMLWIERKADALKCENDIDSLKKHSLTFAKCQLYTALADAIGL